MNFMERFLEQTKATKKDPETRHTIVRDKWDKKTVEQLEYEMKEYNLAAKDLQGVVDTGIDAMSDTLLTLFKADPHLKDVNDIRPSYHVNYRVMSEMLGMKEYESLHATSSGDPISAGLAACAMEPELEILFDKLGDEVKQAQQIEQMLSDYEDSAEQADELAEALAGAESGTPEAQNFQENLDALNEHMDNLKDQMNQASQDLQDSLDTKGHSISTSLEKALDAAESQADSLEQAEGWSLSPGGLKKMDAKSRLALAKKLNTEKFKKMAEMFGRMQNLALTSELEKSNSIPEEVYDITQGANLNRTIPSELIMANDDVLVYDFIRRFVEHSLSEYALRGREELNKGSIILLEDGSSSMMGTREVWSKAIALALLKIASIQNRPFRAIHFASANQYVEFLFDTSGQSLKMERKLPNGKVVGTFQGIEAVMDFAETGLYGGPLRVDQRVITPNGWREIGSLEVGDQVYGPDGRPTTVIGVYPQGKLDLYEVSFKDGARVVCDGNHTWTVRNNNGTIRDMTLNAMMEKGLRARPRSYRFSVPMSEPVVLPEHDFQLHPYLLGYLLGDGSLGDGSSVQIHSSESEHPWRDYLPPSISVTTFNEPTLERCGSYGLKGKGRGQGSDNVVIDALKELGLFGLRGSDKFIPSDYLVGSIEQRFDLLCGLLDSDGSIVSLGGFEFSNTSLALAEGVVELTQSLGGVASICEGYSRESEQTRWRVCGRISPTLGAPFKLTRKHNTHIQAKNPYRRSIVSAERVESDEAVCIKVDREDGLFLTEGYVVTHNTDFVTPLSRALTILGEEFSADGSTESDIVFLTDGSAGVPSAFIESFKKEQDRLAFSVYGIAIETNPHSEPFNTICDGKVLSLQELKDPNKLTELFKEI